MTALYFILQPVLSDIMYYNDSSLFYFTAGVERHYVLHGGGVWFPGPLSDSDGQKGDALAVLFSPLTRQQGKKPV
jgi:hypothetical protein